MCTKNSMDKGPYYSGLPATASPLVEMDPTMAIPIAKCIRQRAFVLGRSEKKDRGSKKLHPGKLGDKNKER